MSPHQGDEPAHEKRWASYTEPYDQMMPHRSEGKLVRYGDREPAWQHTPSHYERQHMHEAETGPQIARILSADLPDPLAPSPDGSHGDWTAMTRADMAQLPEPETPRRRWDVVVILAAAVLTGLGVVAVLAWRVWG